MAGRTLTVYLAADTSRANKQLSGFGQTMQNIGKVAGIAAAAGLALAVDKMVELGQEAVNLASDFQEASSKATVLFGKKAVKDIQAWADTASEAFGQSKLQATQAASSFAVFGKSAGLHGKDLAGFSKELTVLASDMASFSNTDVDTAITAIGAALRGESEPIRQFGVLLDDATLKARAMEMGIYDGTGSLTAQQKVLAAQAEILAQTGDAQGDFTRTADGLANSTKTATAKIEDMKIEIGQALLPIVQTFMSDALMPLIDSLGEIWKKVAPQVTAAMKTISDWFAKDGKAAIEGFTDWLTGPGFTAMQDFAAKGKGMADSLDSIGQSTGRLLNIFGGDDKESGTFLGSLARVLKLVMDLQVFVWTFSWGGLAKGLELLTPRLENLASLIKDIVEGIKTITGNGDRPSSGGGSWGGSTTNPNSNTGSNVGYPSAGSSDRIPRSAGMKTGGDIIIQAGIGDPVAIAREVDRVLRLSETRLGVT